MPDLMAMDVSAAAYEELKMRLQVTGQGERIKQIADHEVLDLSNIVLQRETDERVQVYIVFDGKRLKPPETPGTTDRPAAKSSTSVMQAGVCQACGCPMDGQDGGGKVGCQCKCHR